MHIRHAAGGRVRTLVAVAVAATLLAAACGGDDDDDTAAIEPTDAPATSTARDHRRHRRPRRPSRRRRTDDGRRAPSTTPPSRRPTPDPRRRSRRRSARRRRRAVDDRARGRPRRLDPLRLHALAVAGPRPAQDVAVAGHRVAGPDLRPADHRDARRLARARSGHRVGVRRRQHGACSSRSARASRSRTARRSTPRPSRSTSSGPRPSRAPPSRRCWRASTPSRSSTRLTVKLVPQRPGRHAAAHPRRPARDDDLARPPSTTPTCPRTPSAPACTRSRSTARATGPSWCRSPTTGTRTG